MTTRIDIFFILNQLDQLNAVKPSVHYFSTLAESVIRANSVVFPSNLSFRFKKKNHFDRISNDKRLLCPIRTMSLMLVNNLR